RRYQELMENSIRPKTAILTLLVLIAPAIARSASPVDFYVSLLGRGIAHYQSGAYDAATKELRVAAFGLVDNIEQFETAQAYLASAAARLSNEQDARYALLRLIAAERLQHRYAKLALPDDIRASVEAVARKVLTPVQQEMLHDTAPIPAPVRPTPRVITPRSTPGPVPAQPPATSTTTEARPIVEPAILAPPARTESQRALPPPAEIVPPVPLALPPARQPGVAVPQTPVPGPRPPSAATGTPTTTKPGPVPVPVPQPSATVVPAPESRSTTAEPATPSPADRQRALAREQARIEAERKFEQHAQKLEQSSASAPTPAVAPSDLARGLAAGDAALSAGDVMGARAAYARLLAVPALDHAAALRIGEGLYQSGAYRDAVRAYERGGEFRPGEDQARYHFAVSLYEAGQYGAAKRMLASAIGRIDLTPEVVRNRVKIENAIE
ncbi:MAG: hypothetical protein ABI837_02000, partial [Acidobacteriota bacterium]